MMEDGLPRTNNLVESWHLRFETIVRKHHGGVFSLINELRLEDHRGAHELARLEAGHPKTRRPDKPTRQRESRLVSIFARRQELGDEETIRRIAYNITDTNDHNDDDDDNEDENSESEQGDKN